MIKSLSIIFPVFNEELRLKSSFNHIKSFLKKKKKLKIEIIFVDDGSKDNSYNLIVKFVNNFKLKNKVKFKIVKSETNLGKGAALKLGVEKAAYDWILTTDIDMSVSLFQISAWEKKKLIEKKHSVYFASRSHKKSIVERNFIRKVLGDIGSFLISVILNINIKDTQCGYKLYKRQHAKFAFSKLKNCGWDHDIELILLLKSKNIAIKELPIKWMHKENSKVNIFLDPIKMFIGILIIRFRYL
jgi:dolichyl-phosphate beta-glucosyltransferase